MAGSGDLFRERYRRALEAHVRGEVETGETADGRGLGRAALDEGRGLHDLLSLHHSLSPSLITGLSSPEDIAGVMAKAEEFLSEVAAPFEMIHQALRDSERRFQDIAEVSGDWMWETDSEHRFTLLFGQATETTPLRPGDLIGRTRWDIAGADPLTDAPWLQHKAQLDAQKPFRHFRYQAKGQDGRKMYISASGKPVFDRKGNFLGYRGTATDETAMVEARRDADAAEALLRRVFETSQDLILVSDNRGIFVRVSPSAAAILGYDPEEMAGHSGAEFVHPEDLDDTRNEMRMARRRGMTRSLECRCIHKDGRVVTLWWKGVWSAPSRQYFFIGRDITERRNAENQLRQAQKIEAIGNLTGGMAHDFNNLLGIIVGNLDLARDRSGNDAELRELIGEALDAALRGADLTRRLLAFARRQPLRPARIDVNELVSDTVRLLRRLLGETVEVSLDLAESVWPVTADPGQLEASLANLATNARDAMPRGGRLIITTANRRLDADYAAAHPEVTEGDFVMIEVSDTGIGMPPKVMSQIFEPFFTTKEPGRGTGLGLSMVFGFLRQSGGHVSVYSEPAVGTTFRLYLPRMTTEALPREVLAAPAIERGSGESVLVVEDNPAMRRTAMRQLHELGYRVREADCAAAAIEQLRDASVDLLLTDIVMAGGMDGVELAQLAAKRWPALKIVLTSGFPQAKVDGNGELLGNKQLLSKPYRKEELAAVVRAALDES